MRPTPISATHWVTTDSTQVERRVRLLGPRLPEPQFLSHLTAAGMWGMPLPTLGTGDPMHVSVFSPQPRPRANGITGHELDPRVTRVVTIDDIQVSDPTSTWCQLASMLSLPDLVAVADAIIMPEGDLAPLVSIEELGAAVDARKGHRGAGQLRDALDSSRMGSASRIESVLRVFLHAAGLPEPHLHLPVRSDDGSFRTDIPIAYPEFRVGVDVHLESNRPFRVRSAELERLARLDDLGWRMLAFSDADIHPSRQFELRQKTTSLQNLLLQQGWMPGSSAA